jgi:hypothetical protein
MELKDGIYRARALGAGLGETKSGAEQVAIEFDFLDFEGTRLTYYGTFSDKAVEHTLRALRTAGWRGDDLADLSSIGGPDAPEVDLVVENEEWEGKVRLKVRWVNPRGGLGMKAALAPDKAKAFAARMRGQVAAFDRTAGAPKPTSGQARGRPPEPPPHTDDDHPPF